MLTDGFLRQYSLASGHKHSITCNPGAVSKEMVDGLLLCPKCPFWWKHGASPEVCSDDAPGRGLPPAMEQAAGCYKR